MASKWNRVVELISRFVIDNSVEGQNFKDRFGYKLSDIVHNTGRAW